MRRRTDYLETLAQERVLVLDGAMGTMIQQLDLTEADVTFSDRQMAWGCNDLLSLTRPDYIAAIHRAYLESGADIIETNTFGANRFSLEQYGLEDYVYDINLASAEVARMAVEEIQEKDQSRYAFVAGVLGPTGRAASFSSSVDDPAYREVSFVDFQQMYREQINALLDGGVDILLVETVFDTLVAKAAITAAFDVMEERNITVPVMVSASFSDTSKRLLSGQTLEAFVVSLSSFGLFSLGLNCSMGAKEMLPLLSTLSHICPCKTSAHPNAGFPDAQGNYRQQADEFAQLLAIPLESGQLNIVGGCCGTTPDHIAALAPIAHKSKPRAAVRHEPALHLSGLEPLIIPPHHPLVIIGERANVAGSRTFARLIREGKFEQAVFIAKSQVEQGASILDICMDDPLIDASIAMVRFLRHLASDPEAARVPFMIDSSSWEVVCAALTEIQGRAIVNSISLKEGEELFLRKARHIVRMGAIPVVMLFDEAGQADTFERKCSVAERSYRLLVEGGICDPDSIIFDPNILAIATGIEAHDTYARDFIRACEWIKEQYPQVKIVGGISNLSFSFRGNNALREAIHAVFVDLAAQAGLDMAIMNPISRIDASAVDPKMAVVIREALLIEQGDKEAARNALIALAIQDREEKKAQTEQREPSRRDVDLFARLSQAIIKGDDRYLQADLAEAMDIEPTVLIEGPLLEGMETVGRLFSEGKLFLPQVVRAARVMKKAVDILTPRLEQSATKTNHSKGTVVLATVKGDVHDIGKNIVSLVLRCNSFSVIDLGVMVPAEAILQAAKEEHADIVGLSGLITPSLSEMASVCSLFNEAGMSTPILIGGATTSEEHTACKLAPLNPGRVIHAKDAAQGVSLALKLVTSEREDLLLDIDRRYAQIFRKAGQNKQQLLPLEQAREKQFVKRNPAPAPAAFGIHELSSIPLDAVISLIDWPLLASGWRVPAHSRQADELERDAKQLLDLPKIRTAFSDSLRAVVGIFPARSRHGETVVVFDPDKKKELAVLRFFRMQHLGGDGMARSLADYVSSQQTDAIGMFVATAGIGIEQLVGQLCEQEGEYEALLATFLADRLVEALSAYVHDLLKTQWWAFGAVPSIRPAIGYPSAPDHRQKETLFSLLDATRRTGVELTGSYAMKPAASVCGFYFVGEGCRYFSLGKLGRDQLARYAKEEGIALDALRQVMRIDESTEDVNGSL